MTLFGAIHPNIRRRVLAAALMAAIGTGSALPMDRALAASNEQDRLDQVRDRISATKDKISQKKQQERSHLQALQATEQALEAAQNKLAHIEHDLRTTSARVGELQQQLVMAQNNLAVAEKDLSGHYGRYSRRLRAIYEAGPLDFLEIVFTANNFSDLIVRFEMMQRLLSSDVELFNQVQEYKTRVQAEKDRIEATKRELERRQGEIVSLRKDQAEETNRARGKVRERSTMLKKIVSERKAFEAALDEEEREARRLESFIRGQQKRTGSTPARASAGSMIWPVRGSITSEFGWRIHPILRTRRYHSGLDIAVRSGTSVAAAASGTVILSGWVGGYGKTVIIDHGGGISSLYGHNSVLLVSEGASVTAGQIIAKSGSTGLSTGPHVHFEVRRNGEAVNPHDWLR